jgi:amino acid transporter
MMIQTVLAISLVFAVSDFKSLASLTILFTIIPYLFSCLSTIRLLARANWKTHVLHTRYIPFLAVISSVALLAYMDLQILLMGSVFLVIGCLLFIIFHHNRKQESGGAMISGKVQS